MNRIDRLSAIIIHLQAKRYTPAEELASRFEISKRTVFRDIRALEEAGVPIGSENGHGYFIVEGYHLPPVMFTREEAGALIIAEKLAEKLLDHSMSSLYNSALYKIRSVLPDKSKEYIDALHPTIDILHANPNLQNNILGIQSTIHLALVEKRVLAIEYQNQVQNEIITERPIEPISICFYGMAWHLIAYCRLRKDYRDFRIDRIKKLEVLNDHFTSCEIKNTRQFFNRMFDQSVIQEVVIRCSKKTASLLHNQKYYYGFMESEDKGDTTIMYFASNDLTYFARWLLMFADKDIEVLAPDELKNIFQAIIERIHQKFSFSR